jgi:hypothetical protein
MVEVPETVAPQRGVAENFSPPGSPQEAETAQGALPEGFVPLVDNPDKKLLPSSVIPAVEGGGLPPGFVALDEAPQDEAPVEEQESPSSMAAELGEMFMGRLLGTDIGREDPLMWTRLGTQTAGAIIGAGEGALIGAQVSGPIPHPVVKGIAVGSGALVGGAIGSLFGAVTPEAALQSAEDIGLVEEGTRERLGLSDGELWTVVQGEALMEVAFPGAFALLRPLKRGGVAVFTGLSKEARQTATRVGMEEGIWLTPIQLGRRSIAKGYVFIFGRLPAFGGRTVAKFVRENERQYRDALENLPGRFGPMATWSQVSELIARDAKQTVQTFRDEMKVSYEAIWKQADELGVAVRPSQVFDEGNRIIEELSKRRQGKLIEEKVFMPDGSEMIVQREVVGDFPADVQPVVDFIQTEILPMRGEFSGQVAEQTFKQMDALAEKAQNLLAKLDPADQREARKWMNDMMQAIQFDALQNATGPEARAVREEIIALDGKFSKFWQEIADTATAHKFASIQRKGLKGVSVADATKLPVDELTNIVRATDSPQVARELHALVGQETYNRTVGTYLQDAFERGFVEIGDDANKFSPEQFAKALGLDKSTASRREAVGEMLRLSDTGVTLEILDELVDIGKVIQNVDIPNISVFLARSATIGGVRSLVNRLIPGAVAGGAAVQTGFLGVNFVTAAVGIIGNRMFMRALANPDNAQLTRVMFSKDASDFVRRQHFIRFMNTAIEDMTQDDLVDAGLGGPRQRVDPTGSRFLTEQKQKEWKVKAKNATDLFIEHVYKEAEFQGLISREEADAVTGDEE